MISQRGLEAAAVGLFFYLLLFILIVLVCMMPLLFAFWPLTMLYLLWMYLDRRTPVTCGRGFSFVRKNVLWHYFRSYFPQTLVKTADLDLKQNYILALFPHGIFSTSAFSHFFSETSDFFKLYPGIKVTPVTLAINFNVPILRDVFLATGCCSCDKESILYRLNDRKGGQAVLLVPGGAAEALLTVNGSYKLVLKERKGFIRVAHQAGANVIPVFAFGETNTYTHVNFKKDSYAFMLQQAIRRVTGIAPCVAWGRSVLWKHFGFLPHRTPVITVVGKPIKMEKYDEPPDDVVDRSHAIFMKELNNLFETYKHKYVPDPDNVHLEFE